MSDFKTMAEVVEAAKEPGKVVYSQGDSPVVSVIGCTWGLWFDPAKGVGYSPVVNKETCNPANYRRVVKDHEAALEAEKAPNLQDMTAKEAGNYAMQHPGEIVEPCPDSTLGRYWRDGWHWADGLGAGAYEPTSDAWRWRATGQAVPAEPPLPDTFAGMKVLKVVRDQYGVARADVPRNGPTYLDYLLRYPDHFGGCLYEAPEGGRWVGDKERFAYVESLAAFFANREPDGLWNSCGPEWDDALPCRLAAILWME